MGANDSENPRKLNGKPTVEKAENQLDLRSKTLQKQRNERKHETLWN